MEVNIALSVTPSEVTLEPQFLYLHKKTRKMYFDLDLIESVSLSLLRRRYAAMSEKWTSTA